MRDPPSALPRLSVGGDLLFEGTCSSAAASPPSAGLTAGPDCQFGTPGSTALDLTNAELSSHLRMAVGVRVWGTLRLTGATVHGALSLKGLQLSDPDGRSSLAAQSTTVDGDVAPHGLSAAGGKVNLRAATIGGALDLRHAALDNPDAFTLSLHQAHVRGRVLLVDGVPLHRSRDARPGGRRRAP